MIDNNTMNLIAPPVFLISGIVLGWILHGIKNRQLAETLVRDITDRLRGFYPVSEQSQGNNPGSSSSTAEAPERPRNRSHGNKPPVRPQADNKQWLRS